MPSAYCVRNWRAICLRQLSSCLELYFYCFYAPFEQLIIIADNFHFGRMLVLCKHFRSMSLVWYVPMSIVPWVNINKQCGRRVGPTRYAPARLYPWSWPFDLEIGVRVASKVGNVYFKFGYDRPLGSRIIHVAFCRIAYHSGQVHPRSTPA